MTQSNTTINSITAYGRHLERVGKSRHTVRAYLSDLASFVQWFQLSSGADFDPQATDPRDIIEYRAHLIRKGTQPSTINRRLIALRRFFQWAKRQGLISQTPFEALGNVTVKSQRGIAPRWLTRNEQLAFLRAVRRRGSVRDYAIIQTLLGAGLRVSELVALRLSDVKISERSGWLRVRAGKGSKARDIPVDNHTRQALATYLQQRQSESEIEMNDQEALLFVGQRGALNEPGVNYLVHKYAYQARLSHVTPHTLRHTFAKNLVDAGVPLDQVATLLGHESIDTTKIYTRPSEQDLEKAVRKGAGELDQI